MTTQPGVHPSADILQAFSRGKLGDSASRAVREHLHQCDACLAEAAALTTAPAQMFIEPGPNPAPSGPPPLLNLPPELTNQPDYEVLRELGHGGMGVVYLVRHKLSGRIEVFKVMSNTLIGQANGRERFLREIQSAARLNHNNVVKMHTALERGELLVLVMEYVEGEDLGQVVKSRGRLAVLNACDYVQQAALGLQHAFEKGMIHRDIKPQNLILAREGKKHIVKILDFGLAKARLGDEVDTALTGTGAMMGTPGYVALEQSVNAASVDIRADVYSLGCTLYHLLAGSPPFSGRSAFEVMQAHHTQEARPLHQVRPEVSADLAAVVGKMMAKEPRQRYQTPMEVVKALEPFVKGTLKPIPSPPPQPPPIQKTMSEDIPVVAEVRPHVDTEGKSRATRAGTSKPTAAPVRRKWLVVLLPLAGLVGLIGLIVTLIVGLIVGLALNLDSPSTSKAATNKPWSDNKPGPPPREVPVVDAADRRIVTRVKDVAGIELVQIPGGEFYMGSDKGDVDAFENETPLHKVRISGPFWLGKYQVTVGEFKRFVGATDYETEAEKKKDKWTWRKIGFEDTRFDQTDEHPVVCVSWNDAKVYCAWLADKTGANVRLPREAEWEYSCRARSTTKDWVTTKYYFGDNAADLGDYAWWAGNTNPLGPRPCGQKKPNAFGLYDMHGLVWEWCDDAYQMYRGEMATDPVGAGASRVIRSGAFNAGSRFCRAAYRYSHVPSYRYVETGFRVLVWH